MVMCDRCGANCDVGEVVGGICLDCLDQEKQNQSKSSRIAKLLNSPSYQMELNLEVEINA